jgi:S1-C subfamily serine protease
LDLGDVVVAIDGHAVTNAADLFTALESRQAGETVSVTVARGGQQQDVPVTLETLP